MSLLRNCRNKVNTALALLALVCLGHIRDAAAHVSARSSASAVRRLRQDPAPKPGDNAAAAAALPASTASVDWAKEAASIWSGFDAKSSLARTSTAKAAASGSLWATVKSTPDFNKRVNAALDLIAKMFPAEAQKINKHRTQLVRHIVGGTSPAPKSALAMEQHAKPMQKAVAQPAASTAADCIFSLANFATVAVARVLAFMGFNIPSRVRTTLTQNLRRVPARVAALWKASARAIRNAPTTRAKNLARAKLVWEIFANGLNDVIQAIKAGA